MSSFYLRLTELFKVRSVMLAFIIFVIAACYGYEIFTLNLTTDEELAADIVGWVMGWNGEGRWAMGLLSALVMPNTAVPTVSCLIAVVGVTASNYLIFKKLFGLSDLQSSFVASLAISLPTLAFTFTFSTLAYGVGIGYLLIAFSFLSLSSENQGIKYFTPFFAAFAIGIYQVFAFLVIMIGLFEIFYAIRMNRGIKKSIVSSLLFIVTSIVIYYAVDFSSRKYFGFELSPYIKDQINLNRFFTSPVDAIGLSIDRLYKILVLSVEYFGLSSPWLSITILTAVAVLIANTLIKLYKGERIVAQISSISLIVALGFICILMGSLGAANLRSLFYLPLLVGCMLGAALKYGSPKENLFLFLFVFLSIIGNAVINNRLFSSNEYQLRADQDLAFDIAKEIRRIKPALTPYDISRVEMVGKRELAQTGVKVRYETIGNSSFEWGDGHIGRAAAFIRTTGILVVAATPEERVGVFREGLEMPAWPNPGWVRMVDGVVLFKLSAYTQTQRNELCMLGAAQLCLTPVER